MPSTRCTFGEALGPRCLLALAGVRLVEGAMAADRRCNVEALVEGGDGRANLLMPWTGSKVAAANGIEPSITPAVNFASCIAPSPIIGVIITQSAAGIRRQTRMRTPALGVDVSGGRMIRSRIGRNSDPSLAHLYQIVEIKLSKLYGHLV